MKTIIAAFAGIVFTFGAANIANADFVINEVDTNTRSVDGLSATDELEFVELLGDPNESLDGFSLIFFNGSGEVSYRAFDLDGQVANSNGLFTLGAAAVPNVDASFESLLGIAPNAANIIQNGIDAIALYMDDATSFPDGSSASMSNLIDAIVYRTSGLQMSGLLADLGQSVYYNENSGTDNEIDSLSRIGDEFVAQPATPGAPNVIPEPGSFALLAMCCLPALRRRRR